LEYANGSRDTDPDGIARGPANIGSPAPLWSSVFYFKIGAREKITETGGACEKCIRTR
jgi:hypothetical protein